MRFVKTKISEYYIDKNDKTYVQFGVKYNK